METSRLQVLIVEDEAVVALDLALLLEDQGYICIGPAPSIESALSLLSQDSPDFCVLDANLRGKRPVEVARALAERGIPFVYLTGYSPDSLRDGLPPAPVLEKPLIVQTLLDHIDRAVGRGCQLAERR